MTIYKQENEKDYLSTVFKIDKKEGFNNVRINEIDIQNNYSTINYLNNYLMFLTKAVDYLNKPLKGMYEGDYDQDFNFWLLNTLYLDPKKKYNSVDDLLKEINETMLNVLKSNDIVLNENYKFEYNSIIYNEKTDYGYIYNDNRINNYYIKILYKYIPKNENVNIQYDIASNFIVNKYITTYNMLSNNDYLTFSLNLDLKYNVFNNDGFYCITGKLKSYGRSNISHIDLYSKDDLLFVNSFMDRAFDDIICCNCGFTYALDIRYSPDYLHSYSAPGEDIIYIDLKEIDSFVFKLHYDINNDEILKDENGYYFDIQTLIKGEIILIQFEDDNTTIKSQFSISLINKISKLLELFPDFVVIFLNNIRFYFPEYYICKFCHKIHKNCMYNINDTNMSLVFDIAENIKESPSPYIKRKINQNNNRIEILLDNVTLSQKVYKLNFDLYFNSIALRKWFNVGDDFKINYDQSTSYIFEYAPINLYCTENKIHYKLDNAINEMYELIIVGHNIINSSIDMNSDDGCNEKKIKNCIFNYYNNKTYKYIYGDLIMTIPSTGIMYDGNPSFELSNCKENNLLNQDLFSKIFNNQYFIRLIDDYNYEFVCGIIPVENVAANISINVKKKYVSGLQNNLFDLPNVFRKNNKNEFEINDNLIKYKNDFQQISKFYSLFNKSKTDIFDKLGIKKNKLIQKENEYYKYFNFYFSQSIYTGDLFYDEDIIYNNYSIFSYIYPIINYDLLQISHTNITEILDNNSFNHCKLLSSNLKKKILIKKEDFKLKTDGIYIAKKTFSRFTTISINFKKELLLKYSYSDNIEQIVNDCTNEVEISKLNINLISNIVEDYTIINLKFDNLTFNLNNHKKPFYIYIDSSDHYPFITGTNAVMELEYY